MNAPTQSMVRNVPIRGPHGAAIPLLLRVVCSACPSVRGSFVLPSRSTLSDLVMLMVHIIRLPVALRRLPKVQARNAVIT
jgi:hypothetical protein